MTRLKHVPNRQVFFGMHYIPSAVGAAITLAVIRAVASIPILKDKLKIE